MCFSAGASFGASALIGVISVACFARANAPSQRIWACIPLFFSIQQCLEGVLWLSLINPEYSYFYSAGMYGFLLFAQVIWPIMVPVAAYAAEPKGKRKKILKAFLGMGMAVAIYHLYCLLSYKVQAIAQPHHIRYRQFYPDVLLVISGISYFFAVVPPLFISSLKSVRWLGVALVISYIASRIFYHNNVVSIWCYFAAILSGITYMVILEVKTTTGLSRPG